MTDGCTRKCHERARCFADDPHDNWMCGLLIDIRRRHAEHVMVNPWTEQRLLVITAPDEMDGDFVLLGWYKDRGHTETFIVMDENHPRVATLDDIMLIHGMDRKR